jgi:hypothetical protein
MVSNMQEWKTLLQMYKRYAIYAVSQIRLVYHILGNRYRSFSLPVSLKMASNVDVRGIFLFSIIKYIAY